MSQSPSFSAQALQLQNPISPLHVVVQLTREKVLAIDIQNCNTTQV